MVHHCKISLSFTTLVLVTCGCLPVLAQLLLAVLRINIIVQNLVLAHPTDLLSQLIMDLEVLVALGAKTQSLSED